MDLNARVKRGDIQRVLVGMSGGIDSSVCAFVLKQLGYDVIGATMRLVDYKRAAFACSSRLQGQSASACCLDLATERARATCALLQIPHHVFDCTDEFEQSVVARFVRDYEHALTPNPCIECNRALKFGSMWRYAKQLGCDALATGHYARVVYDEQTRCYRLLQARARDKDQSYVLYVVPQEILAHVLVPLGDFASKMCVRMIARQHGLTASDSQESQDICFVPDGNYVSFIERYRGAKQMPGPIVDRSNAVLGYHKGLANYTIGQRKGMGIAAATRLYVCDKVAKTNTLVVGTNDELFSSAFSCVGVNWSRGEALHEPFRCEVVVRYRGKRYQATVAPSCGGRKVTVKTDEPLRAVSPGQSAVCYFGDEVICGGMIFEVFS